jgi:hypothetical protein
MSEAMSRISTDLFNLLMEGFCGKFCRNLLESASHLFHALMITLPPSNDVENRVVSALQQDYFLLGDKARMATLSVLGRCTQNQVTAADLNIFWDTLWELHQVEDTAALPSSDSVARFVQRYTAGAT